MKYAYLNQLSNRDFFFGTGTIVERLVLNISFHSYVKRSSKGMLI